MAGSNNWKFKWPFGRRKKETEQFTPEQVDFFKRLLKEAGIGDEYIAGDNIPMPISDGRSSVPDVFNSFAPTSKLQEVPPDFSIEYHDTLKNLASYNADFSYAVDNIVQLGNTKHQITFSDKVSDSQAREMLDYLKLNESSWYGFSDGQRGLKADALSQVAIHGCLSIENIPDKGLKGIKQVVRVDPKNIRFVYDTENDMYIPCQQAPTITGGKKMVNGLVQLNQRTYNYIGMRKYSSSPYPTPPLITAIAGLVIQNKMAGNFSFIMDKLGMLGFLSAEVTKPDKFKGESDEAYFNRMVKYLDTYVYPQLAKNLSKGVVAGFKDTHKFELQGNNMNVSGAQGLVEIVNLMVFAGLKQDPNMLGRNYSTTETFGRVILTKLISQVEDYQAVVDSYFERLYLMALRLAGFNPGYVEVTSDKPLVSDQFKDQQAEEKKIANVKTKRDMGIISQEQAAHELGYDKPFSKEPLGMGTGTGTGDDPSKKDESTGSDGSDPKENSDESQNMIEALIKYHNGDSNPFDYASGLACGHGRNITRNNFQDFTDFGDPKLNNYTKNYFNSINNQFKKALEKITPKWKKKWETYDSSTQVDTIQRDFYMILLQYWEPYFSSQIIDDIKLNINKIYTNFRKDKDIFSADGKSFDTMVKGESFFDPPEPVFDLTDFRTIEFMEQFDEMYLGKFITDTDTQKRFYRFLQDEYAGGKMPIGKGGQDVNDWMKGFTNELELEAWKIRRIIDTSVSKVRNFANVNYMKQAQVDEYEIIEVEDKLTCDYCMHMAGQTFKVTQATQQLDKEINSGPRSIAGTSPFVTALKVADFKLLSKEELAARGYLVPPFHPHCRGRLVAHF